jgi:uncharacterized membrane protein (DUF373 family)
LLRWGHGAADRSKTDAARGSSWSTGEPIKIRSARTPFGAVFVRSIRITDARTPSGAPGPDPASSPTHRLLYVLETAIYLTVGIFLTVAALFLVIGIVNDLRHAIDNGANAVDIGVLVLDRILLMLIVAELVYTLGLVVHTHRLSAEPFLYIGLIAVVRRTLIVTASIERFPASGRALTNLLLQLGTLSLLAVALAVAIFLVRRSDQETSGSPKPDAIRAQSG